MRVVRRPINPSTSTSASTSDTFSMHERHTPYVAGFKTKRTLPDSTSFAPPKPTTSAAAAAAARRVTGGHASASRPPAQHDPGVDAAVRRWWFKLGFGGKNGAEEGGEGGGGGRRAKGAPGSPRGGGRRTPTLTDGFMTRSEYVRLCIRVAQALSVSGGGSADDVDAGATAATAAGEWADDVGGADVRAYYPTFHASIVGLAKMWCASNPGEAASFLGNLSEALQPLDTLELPTTLTAATNATTAAVAAAVAAVTIPDGGGVEGGGGGGGDGAGDANGRSSPTSESPPLPPRSPSPSRSPPPPRPESPSSRPVSGRLSVSAPETIPEEGPAPALAAPEPALTANRPAPLIVGSPSVTPLGTPAGRSTGAGGEEGQSREAGGAGEGQHGGVDGGGGGGRPLSGGRPLTPQWTETQGAAEERYVSRVGQPSSERYYSAMAQQVHAASDDRWVLDEHSRPTSVQRRHHLPEGHQAGREDEFQEEEQQQHQWRQHQSPRRSKSRTAAGGRMYLSGTGPAYPSLSLDDTSNAFAGGEVVSSSAAGAAAGEGYDRTAPSPRLKLATSSRWLHPNPHRAPGSILPMSKPSALMGDTARSRMKIAGGDGGTHDGNAAGSRVIHAMAAAGMAHASSRVSRGASLAAVHDMRNTIAAAAFGAPAQPPGRWELQSVDVSTSVRRPATSGGVGGVSFNDAAAAAAEYGGGVHEGESLNAWVRRMKQTSRPPRGGPVALSTGIQTNKLRRAIEGNVGPPRPRTQSHARGLGGEASWNRPGGRPGTSGADGGSGLWSRVGAGAAGRHSFSSAGGTGRPRPATRSGGAGTSIRGGAGAGASAAGAGASRLPEKVRPLPPAPAKPVMKWRQETRGLSYGEFKGAVNGQPLASDGELRRWGLLGGA
jgi:hypothetical protein